ncbi:uncharacterized protein LOC136094332 isoform X2 [Hydra vulgaris]|uniref:uncharacterized protein LOC136094332 isoform X2 n=1 Tax=Hydra vulgaris TaxID=6087 RepID=UPI0032EA3671
MQLVRSHYHAYARKNIITNRIETKYSCNAKKETEINFYEYSTYCSSRLINFLKLEVKPLRQINVMQSFCQLWVIMQMVRSGTTITASWISLVAFFLFSRQIFLILLAALGVFLRLEGGLSGPNSSPVSILFLTCITVW